MNKKILGVFVSLFVVAMLATPVFAVPPTRGTFSQGIVDVTVSPGTSFMTGDIEHVKGDIGASYLYGAPWGNSLPGSGSTSPTMWISHVTWVGRKIIKNYDNYDAGMVVGTVNTELVGIGPYTYNGPSFSFDLAGRIGTVTTGDTFFGLLLEGFGVKHGVSGDLKGLKTMETFTGVAIFAGPLAGLSLLDNTVTYKLPG